MSDDKPAIGYIGLGLMGAGERREGPGRPDITSIIELYEAGSP